MSNALFFWLLFGQGKAELSWSCQNERCIRTRLGKIKLVQSKKYKRQVNEAFIYVESMYWEQ